MEDETRYGAPALSIEQARALAARVAAVVSERDRLREEIESLHLIMSEFQALYAFLDHAPAGAMVASAQTNGSVHDHGPTNTARVQADEQGEDLRNDDAAQADAAPELDAAREASSVDIAGDVDADSAQADYAQAAAPSVQTPAVVVETESQRHTGETPPGDSREQASSESHTGEVTAAERRGEPEACEGDAGVARPLEGTLMARILELIEASDRPKRPWQIQKELNLPRMPSAELSRLVTMGCLVRPKEGIYAIRGRHYGTSVNNS